MAQGAIKQAGQILHGTPPPQPHGGAKAAAAARARGAGYDPLAVMSPQQIKQQATKTVTAAYKPQYQGLSQQQQQLQAIKAKQDADNIYYQQWLDAKTNALQ